MLAVNIEKEKNYMTTFVARCKFPVDSFNEPAAVTLV
jgi:hypothetical protein